MLVAISRNSEAKAMMRLTLCGTSMLQREDGPLVHRYIDSNMLDGYCRRKFCFPLRRASTRLIFFFFFPQRAIQDAIGCLTFRDSVFVLLHSHFYISTNKRHFRAFFFCCLNWKKLYRFYFLSRAFLSLRNIYISTEPSIYGSAGAYLSFICYISLYFFFFFFFFRPSRFLAGIIKRYTRANVYHVIWQ